VSDGNFNRALLPSTPYASGVKAGRAQMKAQALDALQKVLLKQAPQLPPEERQAIIDALRQMLA